MNFIKKKPNKVARGLLISYSGYPDKLSYFMPDNGLANLAGALLSSGHLVQILDVETINFVGESCCGEVRALMDNIFNVMKYSAVNREILLDDLKLLRRVVNNRQNKIQYEIAEKIVKVIQTEGINFVGFKLWEGIGYKGSVRIAEFVKKKCPNILLFAGGPHADLYFDVLMQKTKVFDAISFGDGEETILSLAKFAIERKPKLKDIPNIAFHDGSNLYVTKRKWIDNLNCLPNPCYIDDIYPAMSHDNKIKVITLDESRGCSNLCHFCIHPVKSGTVIREKNSTRVYTEIKHLIDDYGYSCFRFAGSSPHLNKSDDIETGYEKNSKPNILYTSFLHAADIKFLDMKKAREDGCYAVFIGLESANTKLLTEVYGKKATIDEIAEAILQSKDASIYTVVSIIFPGPNENIETRNDTLSFLLSTQPDSVLIMPPRIHPHTEWYRNYERYGFSFDSDDYLTKLMEFERSKFIPTPWADPFCFAVNGKDYKTQILEAEDFANELQSNGITVGVSDEVALLAYLAGYRDAEYEFKNRISTAFLTGRTEVLREVVRKINDSVSKIAEHSKVSVKQFSP